MAESLSPGDYDWFTPADLKKVIDAIHALPDWERVVLVGGQSLTAWVAKYRIALPAFEGPYLTIDADFLGTQAEAEVIARELGSKAQIPGSTITRRMPPRSISRAQAARSCTSTFSPGFSD